MRSVLALLVILGLGAVSALPNGNDNIMNGGERGVDCGATASPFNTAACTCISDLTRVPVPPTLRNANNDSTNDLETGIIGNDLVVAFDLDPRVFTTAAAFADGFATPSGTVRYSSAGSGFLVAGRVYQDPTVWFVNYRGNSDAAACVSTSAATGSNKILNITVGAKSSETLANQYGTNGSACASHKFTLQARADLTEALNKCAWIEREVQTGGPDNGQTYSIFEGKLKVQTDYYNGNLRGAEVIERKDFPFFISILYPEKVNVSSGNVSIIGSVVSEAAITHQIWNSATTALGGQLVDVNAFVGTTFPWSLPATVSGSVGTVSGSLEANLTLNSSASCALWRNRTTAPCDTATQSAELYDLGILCDRQGAGEGVCDINDFFDLTSGDFGKGSADINIQSAENMFAFTFSGGSLLPSPSCPLWNDPSIPAASRNNALACKQNVHLRLKPRSGWCDLNVRLSLVLGVVCRDDARGDGSTTSDNDSWNTTGTGLVTAGLKTGGTTVSNAQNLSCVSGTAPDKNIDLTFDLASDNFCPRVIETATVTSTLSVYDSEFGRANWGADCSGSNGLCAGDAATMEGLRSIDCASLGTNQLCPQVPLIELTAGVLATRATQTQFVFGTTAYLETRVYAEAGVNIASTTISALWITASSSIPSATNDGVQGTVTAPWAKQLFPTANIRSYKTGATITSDLKTVISNDITVNSLITNGTNYFFHATKSNPSLAGTNGARLGKKFEGVSRASVYLDEYTVYITATNEEAAETVYFHATVTITYKDAANQEALKVHDVSGMVGSGNAARARMLAVPALTGRTVSSTAGVRTQPATGSAGSSSTIAGMSATTVVAATVVVGAVVVAAGVGLFVVRRRRTTQRATKRTSSTQELNDTAQVQV